MLQLLLLHTFGPAENVEVRLLILLHRWSWAESDDGGAQRHGAVILWRAEQLLPFRCRYDGAIVHRYVCEPAETGAGAGRLRREV